MLSWAFCYLSLLRVYIRTLIKIVKNFLNTLMIDGFIEINPSSNTKRLYEYEHPFVGKEYLTLRLRMFYKLFHLIRSVHPSNLAH